MSANVHSGPNNEMIHDPASRYLGTTSNNYVGPKSVVRQNWDRLTKSIKSDVPNGVERVNKFEEGESPNAWILVYKRQKHKSEEKFKKAYHKSEREAKSAKSKKTEIESSLAH
jgi:hypothetical protein